MVIRARPNRLWASVYGVSVGNRSWNSPLTWEAAPDRFLLPARNVFTDSILYQLTFLFFFQILSYWFIRCKFIIWNRQSYIVSNKYSKPRNSKSSSSSSKITSCHASSTFIIDNKKTKIKFFRLPQLERGEAPSKEGQSLQRGRRKGGKTDRPACLGRLWTTAAVIRIDGFPRFLNGRLLATSRTGDNEARQTDKLYHGRIRRCTGRR